MTTSANPRSANGHEWHMRLVLALGLVVALRLWTLHISEIDLYFDEAQYWVWSQEPAFGYFSKPPMIAWLIGLTTGLCGQAEFCVRLGAPLVHAASSILIYLTAARLHDRRTGFWAALVFATTPGISFSSALISTDVPLLFFWSGALLAWVILLQDRSWPAAIALGLCLGLGLLSKYAMVYFLLCGTVWLAVDRDSRWLLRDRRLIASVGVAALLIMPNIGWNLSNGLVTFSHTADNANWTGELVHPVRALEFFGAQFGVFGPLLFGALIWITLSALRHRAPDPQRMLLAFSLPVVILILVQAFLSRAHANWAAVAYPACAILVTEALIRDGWRRLLVFSLVLHLAVQTALTYGLANAATISLPGKADPFWRALGWQESADRVRKASEARQYGSILTDNRYMTAELLYYLRDLEIPILAWRPGPVPQDHFQLTRPHDASTPEPALLVTDSGTPPDILASFKQVELVGSFAVAAGAKTVRELHLYRLAGRIETTDE